MWYDSSYPGSCSPVEVVRPLTLGGAQARMTTVCPPLNYAAVALTVMKDRDGYYQLHEHHRHEGENCYCPLYDTYRRLSWDELIELMAILADARRPGMHPAGWEQLPLL